MKKIIPALLLLITVTALLFTACSGDLAVDSLTITGGLSTSYELNETPDFSNVIATVVYNDGSSKVLTASDLAFGALDTSKSGSHNLTISYGGFTTVVTVRVKDGGAALEDGQIITAVSLPESLVLWELNKSSFINKNQDYVVGDDNPFNFTLNLTVYSADGEMLDVTKYESVSSVYFKGSDTALEGDELAKYVVIDEENHTFDFTEEAIGLSFTISSRPSIVKEGDEEKRTKSFNVTIVDGYNIYEAFELNYLTNNNTDTFNFTSVDQNETRSRAEIINDFLINEKSSIARPEGIVGIVIHNDLTIETTDIPREYFYNKDRSSYLYDGLSIFDIVTTEENKTYTIHGNYYTIYSHLLPNIVPQGVGNQNNQASDTSLFEFSCAVSRDKNFDHTQYNVYVKNLMLIDNAPQNNSSDANDNALLDIMAIKTYHQVVNLENMNIQAFYITITAREDYQTVNVKECIFKNSFMNHILLASFNPVQNDSEEPLPKEEYPRLTLNITDSEISECGGPAIIMNSEYVDLNKNKHSGAVVNISESSTVESWVTGEEAWFQTIGIAGIIGIIKGLDSHLEEVDSSFIKTEEMNVNGTLKTFKLVNVIAVNLTVSDVTQNPMDIFNMLQGKIDADGVLTIGDKTILNMDDSSNGGYANSTVSDLKNQSSSINVFTTPSGGIGAVGQSYKQLQVVEGDLAATSTDDILTVYFYSMGLVFGNYHQK